MQTILAALHDVPGVIGSFVVDTSGTLHARNLPTFFDDGALREAGPRLVRMWQALGAQGGAPEDCTLRFGRQMLYLHNLRHGLLCVVAPPEVNRPALSMGCSLVAQQLAPLLREGAVPAPTQATAPPATRAAAPSSKARQTAPPGSARYYRGRRVD